MTNTQAPHDEDGIAIVESYKQTLNEARRWGDGVSGYADRPAGWAVDQDFRNMKYAEHQAEWEMEKGIEKANEQTAFELRKFFTYLKAAMRFDKTKPLNDGLTAYIRRKLDSGMPATEIKAKLIKRMEGICKSYGKKSSFLNMTDILADRVEEIEDLLPDTLEESNIGWGDWDDEDEDGELKYDDELDCDDDYCDDEFSDEASAHRLAGLDDEMGDIDITDDYYDKKDDDDFDEFAEFDEFDEDDVIGESDEYEETVDKNYMTDIEKLEQKYKDMGVELFILNRSDDIELSIIRVPDGREGEGIGTSFMEELIELADRERKIIVTSPTDHFGSSKTRLVKFFKRFGFLSNKGRDADMRFSATMIRYPFGKTLSQHWKGLNEANGEEPKEVEVEFEDGELWTIYAKSIHDLLSQLRLDLSKTRSMRASTQLFYSGKKIIAHVDDNNEVTLYSDMHDPEFFNEAKSKSPMAMLQAELKAFKKDTKSKLKGDAHSMLAELEEKMAEDKAQLKFLKVFVKKWDKIASKK